MNVLVIDTATEACSVALQLADTEYSRFEICPQQHSQRLLPMIDEVLTEAGVCISDLDYLAFGQGPGSFTGVRIATGMIQGLALGSGLHVVGVSTLAAMAQQAFSQYGDNNIIAATDARMGEVYFGHYAIENGLAQLQSAEQVLPPETALEYINNTSLALQGVGTGWQAYEPLAECNVEQQSEILYPNALYMLPLALAAIEQGQAQEVEQIKPVYLRDKVTWKKLPGRE
ncbi:tRNA (adenosine(37)-N6)-threonylcarbamoyltransferase complex dimerization subunit type 1 TsaB [Alteromonadaceae bacterium BrNp21-10]|nr:tRNA (adenosine(37)-N6)-threonylcarbamoyltransferase complex dimerization subunit type 1 TsaB [Alteromonadaceae bacterium BrNp21-10]